MEISFLGHSAFRIKGKSLVLVTDPFSPSIGYKFPRVEADVVTVSHEHFDHNNVSGVSGNPKVFAAPGEYETGGVSLLGISSFHDSEAGAKRGRNTIFVIEMDGIRLAHLGDLGHRLSDAQIEAIGSIDILMIPVGGFFTIGPKEAVEVVSSIEPDIIIPMHYGDSELNLDFSSLSSVDDFLRSIGIKATTLPKLLVRAGEINPETQEVVILTKK